MATRTIPVDSKGKMRVRFMEVELEGANETLLEGIRSITSAIPTRVIVKSAAPRAALTTGAPTSEPAAHFPDESAASEDAQEAAEDPELPDAAPAASVPRRVPRPRAAKMPALLDDLRLDEATSLEDFVGSTKVSKESSDADKALVVAMYLNEHRLIAAIGARHIVTCFGFLDWKLPSDPTGPLRNMKRGPKPLMESGGPGLYKATILGLNHFKQDLRNAP